MQFSSFDGFEGETQKFQCYSRQDKVYSVITTQTEYSDKVKYVNIFTRSMDLFGIEFLMNEI